MFSLGEKGFLHPVWPESCQVAPTGVEDETQENQGSTREKDNYLD